MQLGSTGHGSRDCHHLWPLPSPILPSLHLPPSSSTPHTSPACPVRPHHQVAMKLTTSHASVTCSWCWGSAMIVFFSDATIVHYGIFMTYGVSCTCIPPVLRAIGLSPNYTNKAVVWVSQSQTTCYFNSPILWVSFVDRVYTTGQPAWKKMGTMCLGPGNIQQLPRWWIAEEVVSGQGGWGLACESEPLGHASGEGRGQIRATLLGKAPSNLFLVLTTSWLYAFWFWIRINECSCLKGIGMPLMVSILKYQTKWETRCNLNVGNVYWLAFNERKCGPEGKCYWKKEHDWMVAEEK